MAALDLPAGVEITGAIKPGFEKVLTKEAVAFVADLQRKFNARRVELLAARVERQKKLDAGEKPDFLPETKKIRDSDCPRTSLTAGSSSPGRSIAR
jgi:malate synthase